VVSRMPPDPPPTIAAPRSTAPTPMEDKDLAAVEDQASLSPPFPAVLLFFSAKSIRKPSSSRVPSPAMEATQSFVVRPQGSASTRCPFLSKESDQLIFNRHRQADPFRPWSKLAVELAIDSDHARPFRGLQRVPGELVNLPTPFVVSVSLWLGHSSYITIVRRLAISPESTPVTKTWGFRS
jgi:hypothetical protein